MLARKQPLFLLNVASGIDRRYSQNNSCHQRASCVSHIVETIMVFILPGILLLAIAALLIWGWFFRAVLVQERTVREARQRDADFERWLATPGELLYCVSCQEIFRGPLPSSGCPRCDTRAFVIPVRTSDDPTVAERASQFSPPPVESGGAIPEGSPKTVGGTEPQPTKILQQGKQKR